VVVRTPTTRRLARCPAPWLVVALLLGACGGGRGSDDGAADAGRAEVVRVVDGDTIVVRIAGADERVRLIGIDTPESVDPRSPVDCFGPEASRATADLLPPGTPVRLVRDVEARDRFDRLLAYVYKVDDGSFVNLTLAATGYADVATFPPNVAHTDELVAAVAEARAAGRGLWGACPAEPG
jgi:micrococcal nuclease